MSETVAAPSPGAVASAGRLLREAREKQGLHIAALAAAIKVSPKKLELLESDRFDELPDATFVRALAQTVCRALKTDPAAVMRLLPPPAGHRLETVGEGLNTPFRERPGALVQRDWSKLAVNPVAWATLLLVAGAVVVYFLPPSLVGRMTGRARAAAAAASSALIEPGMPPGTVESTAAASSSVPAASAPNVAAPASAGAGSDATDGAPLPTGAGASGSAASTPLGTAVATLAADAAPAGMVRLRALSPSWVEVSDARGQPLVSRLLQAGESIGLDGVPPLRVRIGNAAGTELVFRDQPTDLRAFTRDNVARLELR
jgi:cytoskeleton protein RodZ